MRVGKHTVTLGKPLLLQRARLVHTVTYETLNLCKLSLSLHLGPWRSFAESWSRPSLRPLGEPMHRPVSAMYPKWSFPAYIVLTIAVGAIFVYRVVRGGEWFIFLMLFLVFGFNVYVSWHVRKKATDTPKPTG